jgi:hypothetical protein
MTTTRMVESRGRSPVWRHNFEKASARMNATTKRVSLQNQKEPDHERPIPVFLEMDRAVSGIVLDKGSAMGR